MDKTGVPVVAGLAVGVAFVILFSAMFAASGGNNAGKISIVTISSISSGNGSFEPEVIKVIVGINNTVRWINNDVVPSSVVASTDGDPAFSKASYHDDGGPNILLPGETFEFTFTKAGEYEYHSVPHPGMQGTVVVLEPGEPDDRYREPVDMNLRQEIENTPLTIHVGRSGDSVQVNVVHSFILKDSDSVSAYLVSNLDR